MKLPAAPISKMTRVRQLLPTGKISNLRQLLAEKLQSVRLKEKIKPGDEVAITAGSRDFGGCVEILQGIVEAVRQAGGAPIIIPSMGSHGGATPEGQTRLLKALGISDQTIGAAVKASMETVCLGTAKSGAKAHLDKIASGCAGIIVLGRVKTHPENTEGIASGLLKMTTVGLGKQTGAQAAHSHGLWESVRSVPELILSTGKILCGVAVVENAFREPVALEVVPGTYEMFRRTDEQLLQVSRPYFARVPFDNLDLLIVDELGKNISGTGMDLNVIGPWRVKGGEKRPDFKRIAVLSLTKQSQGNGLGIGLADFTTKRFRQTFDPEPTYINLLTATEPNVRNTIEASLPIILPSDREAIEAALYSTMASNPRVCRIKNTANLYELSVSESMLDEVREQSGLEVLEEPQQLIFDRPGNLF